VLTAVTFSLFGFIIGLWAEGLRKACQIISAARALTGRSRFPFWAAVSIRSMSLPPFLGAPSASANIPIVYLISGFRWSFYEVFRCSA